MVQTSRVKFPQRQPATLGKLHEIDLGPNAKLSNIAKTEAVKKKIEGGDDEDPSGGTTKVRLGKDGKPWRGRRARTSDDLKRDKLVEEVLRETRRKTCFLSFVIRNKMMEYWLNISQFLDSGII